MQEIEWGTVPSTGYHQRLQQSGNASEGELRTQQEMTPTGGRTERTQVGCNQGYKVSHDIFWYHWPLWRAGHGVPLMRELARKTPTTHPSASTSVFLPEPKKRKHESWMLFMLFMLCRCPFKTHHLPMNIAWPSWPTATIILPDIFMGDYWFSTVYISLA